MPRQFGLFLTATLFVAACSDRPTAIETQPPLVALEQPISPGATVMNATDRFSIAVTAQGSFRPDEPVQITAQITANIPTEAAGITIVLPEVELARLSGWGDSFAYDVGRTLQPAHRRDLRMERDAQIRESVTVTIPAEGLYRVVVRADAGTSAELQMDGRWIQSTAVVERWLLITSSGGVFLETLDENIIPEALRSAPGPLRSGNRSPAEGTSHDIVSSQGLHAATVSSMSTITFQVLYWDSDASSYLPVPNSYYAIRACTKDPGQIICDAEDFVEVETGYTNSSGYLSFSCQGDEYEGEASTYTAAAMRVNGGVVPFPHGYTSSDCGQSYDAILPSDRAKIFLNSIAARDGASSLFGANRSWIEINVSSTEGSFYDPSDDEITILTSHVWGPHGVFVAAHEYGHAYHEDALYGDFGGGCPQPHYLDTESNLQCAYSEGFADYFAASVRDDLGTYYYRNYMSDNNGFPGCVSRPSGTCTGISTEGALIESAFAAMLYDLTDSTVEAHDSIAAPGSYVRELVRTCEVFYTFWRRANGPDEFAYCAENSINPGSYFTPRGATPSSFNESASEPGDWTASRVNANWTFNMYEKP